MTPPPLAEPNAEVPPETETLPLPWVEETSSSVKEELFVAEGTAVGGIIPDALFDV